MHSVVDAARTYKSLFLIAIAGISAHVLVTYLRSPWRKLPPGPKGIPLLGDVFRLSSSQWMTFTHLRKTFGDLIYFNMAGNHMVDISSQRIATDLLDRRAGIYSDRPRNIVGSEIMTGGLMIGFARYNDVYVQIGIEWSPQADGAPGRCVLACGLLAEPDNWDGHLRRTAASGITSMVYDEPPIISGNSESVRAINDFGARVLRASLPGAHLVEFFPWMMYLPKILAPWRQKAEKSYIAASAMFKGLFRGAQERMKQGEDRPSITATLLQTVDRHGLSELGNFWLAGTIYAAGAETTSAVMAWWMLAMVVYPETQKRAQAELDTVVGRDRIPTFTDFKNLPYMRDDEGGIEMASCGMLIYLQGMVHETYILLQNPMGLPHLSIEDDWYEGHFIPAGTIIVANVWHLNRDPEIYGEDTEHFNPARHLDEKGRIAPGPTDSKEEGHFAYGFGRRMCVGKHVANNSLFIDIAMVLWGMNIEPATDAQGKPLPIDVDGCVEDGIIVRPIPFKVKLTPRFPEAGTMLELERESHGLAAFQRNE